MSFNFMIQRAEYKPGELFDDNNGFGAYFEVGDDPTYEWLQEKGFDGNGYTVLGLIDSMCRLDLTTDAGKYEMEAEADNAWVYGQDKDAIERLIAKFEECTANADGINRLIENGDEEILE